MLREALALWRGPALADFQYESFARDEIGRLEELRLVALELRLEADLALGRHAEVVPRAGGARPGASAARAPARAADPGALPRRPAGRRARRLPGRARDARRRARPRPGPGAAAAREGDPRCTTPRSTWLRRALAEGSADRHRHLPVHRHRGLDGAARPARERASTRRCSTSTVACCAPPSRTRAAVRSTRRATRSSSRSRRAAGAIQAAARAQRETAATQLPIRIGIHTGEPSVGPTGYVGLDVPRAARICAAGHGGQVLISQSTRELVEDELPDGIALRDLGEHRLKDLTRPQRLSQLVIEGLPNEFPALRTLENRPTNLPVQPTPLIGREREAGRGRRAAAARGRAPADADRAGRHRQDPARAAGRRRARRGLPAGRLLRRAGADRRSRRSSSRRSRRRSGSGRAAPLPSPRASSTSSPRSGSCSSSTTSSTSSRRRPRSASCSRPRRS